MTPSQRPRDWDAEWKQVATILAFQPRGLSVSGIAKKLGMPQPDVTYLLKRLRDKGLLDIEKVAGKIAPHWLLSERGINAYEGEVVIDLQLAARGQRRYQPQALMQCLGIPLTPPPTPGMARYVGWK